MTLTGMQQEISPDMHKTISILLYHGICECADDALRDRLYALPSTMFVEQIEALTRHGCATPLIRELTTETRASPANVILTVDDGLASAYRTVFPILLDAGFRAAFFPVVGMIGKKGWLTWEELDEMNRHGMEIGSHSLTHAMLPALRPGELQRELTESKKRLEDSLGEEINSFSLPGGYSNRRVREAIVEAGYRATCTSRFGYNHVPAELRALRRFCVMGRDGADYVEWIVTGKHLRLLPRFTIEMAKKCARHLVGVGGYRLLRRALLQNAAYHTLPRFPEDRT